MSDNEQDNDSTPSPLRPSDQFWSLAEEYLENEERSDATPRDNLKDSAASLFGIEDPSSIYIAKATPNGYRNQVWQGQAISRSNEVMVLIDKTNNPSGIADAAQSRLNPRPDNGFDAVVVCEEDSSGGWTIKGSVEYEHVALGQELRKTVSGLELIRIPDPAAGSSISIGDIEAGSGHSKNAITSHLLEAKNLILGGPPGTGKTYSAFQIVDELADGDATQCRLDAILKNREWHQVPLSEFQEPALIWEFIQLHPSYAYEDFVRGLRTDPDGVGFALKSVDGILPIISHVASIRRGKPTVLIIDELNRANVPVVFGETIFAIDPAQRGRPIRLQYDGSDGMSDSLRVPPELLVVATMNTADRSISALDFAIRRRFRFIFLEPSDAHLKEYYGADPIRGSATASLLNSINVIIPDREIKMGHSYLMIGQDVDRAIWRDQLAQKFVYEICPLIREYGEEARLVEPSQFYFGEIEFDILRQADQTLLNLFSSAIESLVPDEQATDS